MARPPPEISDRLLARPGGIEGIVTDLEGRPVAGLRVGIISGTVAFPEIGPETDEAGYYQIGGVAPGIFQVAVHDRDGQRVGLESVDVKSGETATLNFSVSGTAVETQAPLPPLPVIRLHHADNVYNGVEGSYCWPSGYAEDGATIGLCADKILWEGIESTVHIPRGEEVLVVVEADDAPSSLVAHIYADPETSIQTLELEAAKTARLPLDLLDPGIGPGSYLLLISGQWPEGDIGYQFRFMQVPGTKELTAECFYTEADPLPLTYDVLNEPTPTGFDGRNSATCRFSKPISKVSVTLTNDDGSAHGETFFIGQPVYEVPFPLPEGLWALSEKTLELLAPGDYQRRMVAIAEDGETWDTTANIEAALKTVTVVGTTETTPTPASSVTLTPSPTATPTPTPSVTREWDLENIKADGSTVTVLLRVYAGIDVRVTLDGRDPDQVDPKLPFLEFVFVDLAPGKHTIEVKDVVGFTETMDVVVPTPTSEIPDWLTSLIKRLENEPIANPPASITRYEYNGQTVYFIPQRCCDIFSDLYDSDGNIIGHPDGGITGKGDGRAPDFMELRRNESVIWRDQRTYDPGLVQVPAPIESVEVLIMESFPPQYMLVVVSGLPNGCYSFGGYRVEREADTIQIEMLNWKPADPHAICTDVYRTVETNIPLGIDFESGQEYSAVVNDVMETFVVQ